MNERENNTNTNTNTIDINSIELLFQQLPKERYCIKTGRRLQDIPYTNDIEELISIHGFDRSKVVMDKMRYGCAASWILTDSKALSLLAKAQPHAYLIYALSSLFIKPNIENTLEFIDDCENKIISYQALLNYDENIIINVAELTRRILSVNKPIAIYEMLHTIDMKTICSSLDELVKYQITVQECLKQIGLGYYDDKLVNDRKRQRKELFDKQRMLVALTDLEKEIDIALPSFDDIEIPHSELKQLILSNNTSKLKDIIKQNKAIKDNLKPKRAMIKLKSTPVIKFTGIKR